MRREGEINPAIFPNTDCIHRINRCILQEYRVTGTNQENESLEEEKNMTTIMTIAAGLGIGYFVYQYLTSNNGGKLNGRIHKSATDKKSPASAAVSPNGWAWIRPSSVWSGRC